jgi:alkylated DNA repair dioxygenase AlkB
MNDWLRNHASLYHQFLSTLPWKHDEGVIYGKPYQSQRMMVWMAMNQLNYNYAKKDNTPIEFTSDILSILERLRKMSLSFNSCLLNYYKDGNVGMGYHADNEKELGINPSIASISLGAERKFKLKHIHTKEVVDIYLPSGSLLMMSGEIQHFWKHCLPLQRKVKEGRINLTFRKIIT